MLRKIYIIIKNFCREMNQKNISSFAASTAFFIFLSLVPMMILICTIIPFTPLKEEKLLLAIVDLAPDTLVPLIVNIIADVYQKSAGVLSLAAVTTIWSAGKGVLALIRGLNEVNDVNEERNYFVLRVVASFYTMLLLLILVFLLIFNVFGEVLTEQILLRIPKLQSLIDILVHFRFLVVWFVLTILFTMVYTFIPNLKLRFKAQIPGAVFAAVVWSLFSWGFSLYAEYSGQLSTYGSLSMIIFVMLWLYFCFYIIMIGAQINRQISRR